MPTVQNTAAPIPTIQCRREQETMKQYAKGYELKNKAKDTLGGKYKTAVPVCLLSVLLPAAARLFVNLFLAPFLPQLADLGSPTALLCSYAFEIVLSLLLSSVLGLFNVGAALFSLNMACGQPYGVRDLFYGFRRDFARALTLSGVLACLNAVCLYPYEYLLDFFLLSRQEKWLYAAAAALVIGLCVYIPLSLNFSLVYYLMLDFPQKSAGEILRLSCRIMKGQKKRLFCLQLSFLPLMLLCVCSLYIGYLWLNPYLYMTEACFFLDVMKPEESAA